MQEDVSVAIEGNTTGSADAGKTVFFQDTENGKL
jgi:hypothetical protein